METASNLFHTNNTSGGQNCNFAPFAWDNNITSSSSWDLGTTTTAQCTTSTYYNHLDSFHHHAPAVAPAESSYHALLYGGGGSQTHPDPHLMCLKLGKRNYFEDAMGKQVTGFSISKKGKTYYSSGGVAPDSAVTVDFPATVPKCQVEGCHVALMNAKEYHRRHKVCEVHSKAPKVIVLGVEQRFCQQCSRFHVMKEFDETKRSCRRRLAGHNERRRKTSHEHSTITFSTNNIPSQGKFSYSSLSSLHAPSLLSSRNESSISSSDLSSRCSAALQELIAENRAALLGKQLVMNKEWSVHHAIEDINVQQDNHSSNYEHHLVSRNQHHIFSKAHGWDRLDEPGTNNVTLDLMQAPTSAFELLSVRGKSKEDECSQLWTSLD